MVGATRKARPAGRVIIGHYREIAMKRRVGLLLLSMLAAACAHRGETPVATASDDAERPTSAAQSIAPSRLAANAPLQADGLGIVLAGNWREAKNVARDRYRHPRETLQFFGVRPDMTVIEIWPGGGWYTELLAPYLRERGRYVGIVNDPERVGDENRRLLYERQNFALRQKLAARADVYDRSELRMIDPNAPVLGEPGSADAVLTFRNVHNWVMDGSEAQMFEAFYEVLRPGGVLGVVDHRARADAELDQVKDSGYLPEGQVIQLALSAGFRLEARSEINANPKDRKDYPKGVWTLPPRLAEGEKDRKKYLAIGESDRMTLRFVKPRD